MAKMEDGKDGTYALGRVPGRFYVSSRFPYQAADKESPNSGKSARFAYQVTDPDTEVEFRSSDGWELSVRETTTRQQLKALFFEDSRRIERLAFQRFNKEGKALKAERFSLAGDEVVDLIDFLALVEDSAFELEESDGRRVSLARMRRRVEEAGDLVNVLIDDPEVLAALIESNVDAPDVIALANRRSAIDDFTKLLNDEGAFEDRRSELGGSNGPCGPEAVWQMLFERSPWLLGVGAAPQFLHSFDPERLEQTVRGATVTHSGKRVDALMRSAGILSALALVEIKHHRTPLLRKTEYRPGVWQPSSELAGAVAQCQMTLDDAVSSLGPRVDIEDSSGFTVAQSGVCRPRSILVIGSLDEFVNESGDANWPRFESFERYRRSVSDPEILTFDELRQRSELSLSLAEH